MPKGRRSVPATAIEGESLAEQTLRTSSRPTTSTSTAAPGSLTIEGVAQDRQQGVAAGDTIIRSTPGGVDKPLGPGPIPDAQAAARDAGEPFGFGTLVEDFPDLFDNPDGRGTNPPGATLSTTGRDTPLTEFAGEVDEEGNAIAPDILGHAEEGLNDLETLSDAETEAAAAAQREAEARARAREDETEGDIDAGVRDAEGVAQRGEDIAQQGKENIEDLPDRVAADIEGIADRYREDTDVDIDRIEGLGREAGALALEGKNAAAEAAVSASHNAIRAAISKINADPNIPQSRKTAMIAQIQTQGAMSIATVIGANIKDFTAMQVGAMTSTMNAVGSALTARNATLGQMGTAEINAISAAHQTVADISMGYDRLAMDARTNSAQLTFGYNQLRNSARNMNNTNDLALLNEDFYVMGMPYDFRSMNYQRSTDAIGDDFATQLQASGYRDVREAAAAGEEWAHQAFNSQLMADTIGGPLGALFAILPFAEDIFSSFTGGGE